MSRTKRSSYNIKRRKFRRMTKRIDLDVPKMGMQRPYVIGYGDGYTCRRVARINREDVPGSFSGKDG